MSKISSWFKQPKDSGTLREVAVGMSYDSALGHAPVVELLEQEELVQAVLEAAKRFGVPVVRDNELAEKLSLVEPQHPIPEALYKDVAPLFVPLHSAKK